MTNTWITELLSMVDRAEAGHPVDAEELLAAHRANLTELRRLSGVRPERNAGATATAVLRRERLADRTVRVLVRVGMRTQVGLAAEETSLVARVFTAATESDHRRRLRLRLLEVRRQLRAAPVA